MNTNFSCYFVNAFPIMVSIIPILQMKKLKSINIK